MATIAAGQLYGFADGNTGYGYFTIGFAYDSVTRSGKSITVNNARITTTSYSSGFTSNTLYINNCHIGGVNSGISWEGNGEVNRYGWTTGSKTVTIPNVAASTSSLSVTWNGGRSAATTGQNGSCSLPIPTAGSPSISSATPTVGRTTCSFSISGSEGVNGGGVTYSTVLNGTTVSGSSP